MPARETACAGLRRCCGVRGASAPMPFVVRGHDGGPGGPPAREESEISEAVRAAGLEVGYCLGRGDRTGLADQKRSVVGE